MACLTHGEPTPGWMQIDRMVIFLRKYMCGRYQMLYVLTIKCALCLNRKKGRFGVHYSTNSSAAQITVTTNLKVISVGYTHTKLSYDRI